MATYDNILSFLVRDKNDPQPKYELLSLSLEEELEWIAQSGGPKECDNETCPVWDECEGGLKRYRDLGIIPRPDNQA